MIMDLKRVVITGMGVIASLGNTVDEFQKNIIAGKSGAGLITKVDEANAVTLQMIGDQRETEMQNPALAQYELLVSYLKIFLITASRLKTQQQPEAAAAVKGDKEPFIL